jgi:1,4-dihydroxy-2-naphthoate polyprenyltransferase
MLANWLRAIRVRFLLSSIISVVVGLSVTYWKIGHIDYTYAVLTLLGIACLHASIDLLNDYWDFARGIDKDTKRTKFSGGSGVLPDKILTPRVVYIAGIVFLCIGAIVGIYFVMVRGIIIAFILTFAIVSIYFYSSKVVNMGLGEVIIIIKGMLIVQGTYYVQTPEISDTALYNGLIVGLLSAIVLFVNSFPDFEADKRHGRRTLVVLIGKKKGAKLFSIIIFVPYVMISIGTVVGYTTIYSLACLISLPIAVKGGMTLNRDFTSESSLVSVMSGTIWCSRLTSALLALTLMI